MTGVITLSIELELGWGMHDRAEYGHLSSDRSVETETLHRLLNLADRLNLPITFDIVGHLIHDSCSGSHPGPHPESWWTEDPGTDIDTDPLFYAPDLIREIWNRETDHELATHTYSHLLADEATSEELDDELAIVDDLHADGGLPAPTSIVMPRHQQPDYSILADHGIETIRRPIEGYGYSDSNPVSTFWWLLTRDHPTSTLERRNGMLETKATPHPSLTAASLPAGRSSPHFLFSIIPRRIRQALHRRYLIDTIERAAVENNHVHLWTHVYNMANSRQWEPISDGLEYLAERRDEGEILIKRMDELSVPESRGDC
jgi:peptidoglycan/xylan/chitin deacetylase (PgdA/CDA1 family)